MAGKRIIVGSGTNQEAILVRWDEENKKNGLKPVEFQYYDDDSASTLALQSGRADLTFGPNAGAAYKAAKDGKTKEVGTLERRLAAEGRIAFTTQKGNGLAVAAQAALNTLIKDGSYGKILDRWGLSSEASEVRTEPGGPAQEVGPAQRNPRRTPSGGDFFVLPVRGSQSKNDVAQGIQGGEKGFPVFG